MLLRDNKQSGPFTSQQLEALGLKPYDLVWQEGRSAAWRYPSELEELKSFAPVVEEQPFDRFYKKSSTPAEPALKDHTAVIVQKPIPEPVNDSFQETEKKIIAPKPSKVFVTLPAGKAANPANATTGSRPVDNQVKVVEEEKEHSKYNLYATSVNEGFKETVRSTFGESISQKQSKVEYPIKKETSGKSQRILVRSLIAASLLLFGVLIGMYFMNRSQQKNLQELNALVQQIQDRNRKQTMPVANPDFAVQDQQQASLPLAPQGGFLTVEDEAPVIVQESQKNAPSKKPAPKTQKPQEVVVVPDEDSAEEVRTVITPPVKNEVPNELARKNLFQLVHIKGNKYKTGLLGGISNLELTVTNKSLYQLEKVDVVVEYLGPESKVVKTQKVAFQNVAPGEELTIEVPKSSRGVSVRHSITQINSRELGIAQAGK